MTVRVPEHFVAVRPDERLFAVVPARDELSDPHVDVFHAGEDPAADGLPIDDPEPHLDEVLL